MSKDMFPNITSWRLKEQRLRLVGDKWPDGTMTFPPRPVQPPSELRNFNVTKGTIFDASEQTLSNEVLATT